MNIPEIKNNIDLVSIIDELKHRIKPLTIKPNGTLMGQSFNDLLNKFIDEWKLDGDQHSFASLCNHIWNKKYVSYDGEMKHYGYYCTNCSLWSQNELKQPYSFASFSQEEIEEEREKLRQEVLSKDKTTISFERAIDNDKIEITVNDGTKIGTVSSNDLRAMKQVINIPNSYGIGYVNSDQIKTSISKINLSPIQYEPLLSKEDIKIIDECLHCWKPKCIDHGSTSELIGYQCNQCGIWTDNP
jgi:hypothetical protein